MPKSERIDNLENARAELKGACPRTAAAWALIDIAESLRELNTRRT